MHFLWIVLSLHFSFVMVCQELPLIWSQFSPTPQLWPFSGILFPNLPFPVGTVPFLPTSCGWHLPQPHTPGSRPQGPFSHCLKWILCFSWELRHFFPAHCSSLLPALSFSLSSVLSLSLSLCPLVCTEHPRLAASLCWSEKGLQAVTGVLLNSPHTYSLSFPQSHSQPLAWVLSHFPRSCDGFIFRASYWRVWAVQCQGLMYHPSGIQGLWGPCLAVLGNCVVLRMKLRSGTCQECSWLLNTQHMEIILLSKFLWAEMIKLFLKSVGVRAHPVMFRAL